MPVFASVPVAALVNLLEAHSPLSTRTTEPLKQQLKKRDNQNIKKKKKRNAALIP